MKVYIERNNIQVELIRFRKNSDFIAVKNFEVGIYFRDQRAHCYESMMSHFVTYSIRYIVTSGNVISG